MEEATQLHKDGRLAEAERLYKQLIQNDPKHSEALHQYGVLLVELYGPSKVAEARSLVLRAIQLAPSSAKLRNSLGVLHEQEGSLEAAAEAYERAHEKDRSNIQVLANLGRVRKALRQFARAAEAYHKITVLDPVHPSAHYKRAALLKRTGHTEAAIQAYRRHFDLHPSHTQSKFWIAALTGANNVSACPPDMVAGLFDGYADNFDEHLVNKLGYKTPQVLLEVLQEAAGQDTRWKRCFDLGCGTGLMGPLLRTLVEVLEGADLSGGMVQKAAERQCYDLLEVMEMTEFISKRAVSCQQASQAPVDLLVAADVFVYVGDLQPALAAARSACAPASHFCFSTERLTDAIEAGYQVQLTGRYKHSTAYVQRVAQSTGWSVLHSSTTIIRHNSGKPVHGNLFVLQST